MGKKAFFIIPLILSIGIISALPFADALQKNYDEIQCKEGLAIVIKAADGTPKCVKPTTMFNLMERNWILVREAFAQPSEYTDVIPDTSERAMYFSVRASGGMLTQEVTAKFHKFTPYTDANVPTLKPDNPLDRRAADYQFSLESLPSKDKLNFYKLIGRVLALDTFAREPFDVNVDVVSGDGTVLQTWAYNDCDITNYVTYLQDYVNFFQFSKTSDSEIRDRTLLDCRSLSLEVPE